MFLAYQFALSNIPPNPPVNNANDVSEYEEDNIPIVQLFNLPKTLKKKRPKFQTPNPSPEEKSVVDALIYIQKNEASSPIANRTRRAIRSHTRVLDQKKGKEQAEKETIILEEAKEETHAGESSHKAQAEEEKVTTVVKEAEEEKLAEYISPKDQIGEDHQAHQFISKNGNEEKQQEDHTTFQAQNEDEQLVDHNLPEAQCENQTTTTNMNKKPQRTKSWMIRYPEALKIIKLRKEEAKKMKGGKSPIFEILPPNPTSIQKDQKINISSSSNINSCDAASYLAFSNRKDLF